MIDASRRTVLGATGLLWERLVGSPAGRVSTARPGAPVTPAGFQAKGDGVTNDTAALRAFFDACIATGRAGHIPAGTYLVDAGALDFDNGHRRRAWPNITTDGHAAVTFRFANGVNKPMLTLRNGTATSAVGEYWEGGAIGGFTVEDAVGVAGGGTNRHALSLRGVHGMAIGWIRANAIAGSAIHLPHAFWDGGNPDPYAVTHCTFQGAEANGCQGRALTNMNWIGLTMCTVNAVRATNCEGGALYGLGGGNTFRNISVGTCRGWAVHDGDEGEIDRSLLDTLELDDVQYGIRLNAAQSVEIRRCRIIVRHNASPFNPGEGYWPRIALRLAADAGAAVRDTTVEAIVRIKAGGRRNALGKLLNFNNSAGLTGTRIALRILADDVATDIPDSVLLADYSPNSQVSLVRDGRQILPR